MKPEKNVLKGVVMITQIGISMLVPIFLCVFVGRWLDNLLTTNYITVIGIVLGILAAFRNVYVLTKQFYAKEKAQEDAKLKYFEDMKHEREENMKRGKK